MGPRGTQETIKNEHRKTVKKCVKKRDAADAGAAGKMSAGGGVPLQICSAGQEIQANPSKLTRAKH